MKDYKVITDLDDFAGKRFLVRVDLNIPVENDVVQNDFRISKSLDTINFIKNKGGKVILLSHFGREKTDSLKIVYEYLKKQIDLKFIPDIFSEDARDSVEKMQKGEILLFENLRQHEGEEGNDPDFVKHLASFGEIYVNEAFSVAHRDHASITGLAKVLPAYAGIRFDKEVQTMSKAFNPPDHFLVIVGGAKFNTKLPLIKRFSQTANAVFVGGALANDVFRFYGYELGKSLVSETPMSEIAALIDTGKIITPSDVVVDSGEIKNPRDVFPDESIVDSGPQTLEIISKLVQGSKLIIWNGPLGIYEKGFGNATDELMKIVIDADAEVIVGGGDTAVAASKFEATDEQVFISTGGGAMLDFLADGELIGIEALKN